MATAKVATFSHFMKVVPCDGGFALQEWENPPEHVVIPGEVDGQPIRRILAECFQKTDIRSVVVSANVEVIERACFYKCKSLSDFRFEDGSRLKHIGRAAFSKCESLASFVCPRGVESIPEWCFDYCMHLSDLRFEEGSCLKTIDAFGCHELISLVRLVLPRSVESLGERSFAWCIGLSDLRFEEGSCLKSIGSQAFYRCDSLAELNLPQSVRYISKSCFDGDRALPKVTVGRGIEATIRSDGGSHNSFCIIKRKVRPMSDYLISMSELERVPSDLVSGGTGSIALFRRNEKLVVGKFLNGKDFQNDQSIYTRETSALRTIQHGAIVTFVGYTLPCPETEGRFALFTEYVSGGSLADLIASSKTTRIDPTTMVTIVVGIDLAMKSVHSQGIMHRDLKPSNVLLDEQRHPYLCDFGSSRALVSDATLTSAHPFTVYYAAPEIGDEHLHYDTKADVYSFGIMLYELVTGEFALRHLNLMQVTRYISKGKRPAIPTSVLPFTRSLIQRCWATDPARRPSFADIYNDIKREEFRLCDGVNTTAVSAYVDSLRWWETDAKSRAKS